MSAPNKLMRVRFPANGSVRDEVEWLKLDGTGAVFQSGRCPLAALPADADVELVLPATLVAQHLLDVPAVAARHEGAVIRQLLEDRILAGMEDCHFVRGEREDELQSVWVVSRHWMLELSEACRQAGLFPVRALPEQLLLPRQSWSLTSSGYVYCDSTGRSGVLPTEEAVDAVCGETLTEVDNLLATPPRGPANLLEGLPTLSRTAAIPRYLPICAGTLIVAAALAYLLAQFITWRQLASQENHLREAIRQNFAAAHPGVPIVDPILQWRQLHGKSTKTGRDALDQLSYLALGIGREIHPQRLDIEGNTIKITVGTSDAAGLKPALKEKGIGFESRTMDNGLEQLILTRPGARS